MMTAVTSALHETIQHSQGTSTAASDGASGGHCSPLLKHVVDTALLLLHLQEHVIHLLQWSSDAASLGQLGPSLSSSLQVVHTAFQSMRSLLKQVPAQAAGYPDKTVYLERVFTLLYTALVCVIETARLDDQHASPACQ
jgi:hypothetical protein